MKKAVTILTAAAMLFSSFAFATDSDKVNARVKAAFLNDFSAASAINWEKISDFYFATFLINQIEVNAAYNEDGELVGTSRPMQSEQLPINVSLALAKKYEGYTVSKKALELTFEGSTWYYLSVTNDCQALKLKCSASGSIEVERKIKKK
ncbi:MAG: hypothetical protein WKI04_17305 [Ferruginibacter sp.]